jgi:hypothetical protein
VKGGRYFPFSLLFPSISFLFNLRYLKMSTSPGAHSLNSRPSVRYPSLEPIRPTEWDGPTWLQAVDSLEEETKTSQQETPVVVQQSPLVEDPVPPSVQSLASPLEVYKAHVQEHLLTLRETLDRQT